MERGTIFRQPNGLEDWRENDEPTSDLYRLTQVSRSKKLRNPEEYRGSADLRWHGPPPQNYEAERRRRQLVKDQIAEMLDGYKWDWFSTYTVNMQAKPDTVHTMFRNHLAFIEKRAGLPLYAFRGDEYGVLNGRFHVHSLVGNVGDFPAYCGERLLHGIRATSRGRVVAFIPGREVTRECSRMIRPSVRQGMSQNTSQRILATGS